MKKLRSFLFVVVLSVVLILVGNHSASAHNPPSCGNTDCGLIQGNTFYSAYYSPGNPNGTPVSAGGGTWIRTSNTPCGTYYYGGTNYTLYPHTFSCNLPLDTNTYLLMFGVALLGFFQLKKRINFSFPES